MTGDDLRKFRERRGLERADLAEQRASPRMLFGTRIVLHVEGGAPIAAFSYNVSEGGIFARTLVPLANGTRVVVELQPPRTGERVHLPGAVVWRRQIQAQNATAPIGVGIRFDQTGSHELAVHVAGCRSMADPLGLSIR